MSDRFFLQHYFGESEVGIYSANYRLASVMGLVIAAFKFAWTPFFLNLNEESASKEIISTVTGNFVFAGSLMFLIFGLMIDLVAPEKIFGINFIDPRYFSGIVIIPAILISYFLSGLYSTFNAAPFFTGNSRSLFVISAIGVAVNIVLNILLIPKYSMMGAAYATLLTYSLMFVMIFVYSQKIYMIRLNYSKLVIAFGVSLVMFSIGYFVVNKSDLGFGMKLSLDTALIAAYLVAMNVSGIFNARSIAGSLRA
jgi:O-antigen/teichoic acid export membrane protein